MKHLVVAERLSEGDVHPPGAFEGLVEASAHAACGALRERTDQFSVLSACPACGSDRLTEAFEKYRYPYCQCEQCRSLFARARPSPALMHWYLTESPAARFRRDPAFREGMAERMREEAAYRADWLSTVLRQGPADGAIAVVGPRSTALLEALSPLAQQGGRGPSRLVAVEPLPPLRGEGISDVTQINLGADAVTGPGSVSAVGSLADLEPNSCSLVTLLNVIEYAADPAAVIAEAFEVLEPGGRLALTTRSGGGFDLQVLWERANVFPMDHLNLPSVEGMQAMLRKPAAFEVLELSTPGLLDVQLVQRAWQEQPDLRLPRFLEYFFSRGQAHAQEQAHAPDRSPDPGPERLQAFLQENRLSSHMRVVARKPVRGGASGARADHRGEARDV